MKFVGKAFASNDIKEIIKSVPPEDLKQYNISDSKIDEAVLTNLVIKSYAKIIPFAVAFIASAIVIILYIYELIIFTFVSPFIVAFALTTGQARKIMDFFVTAITIFLKPVIITIGIYLALFLYQAFGDIFVMLADEQYYLSNMTSDSFWSEVTFSFLRELSKVFATFASIFILWRVIMNISEFIFKLIGLDKLDSTSSFATSMQQQFSRYGFRA